MPPVSPIVLAALIASCVAGSHELKSEGCSTAGDDCQLLQVVGKVHPSHHHREDADYSHEDLHLLHDSREDAHGDAPPPDRHTEDARPVYHHQEDAELAAKRLLEDHSSTCSTVFLTTVFSTRSDPMHGGFIEPGLAYFEQYMQSILKIPGGRVKAVVLHDSIPENVTGPLTVADGSFSFTKVNISRFPKWLTVNDVRFLLFEEVVKKHPEWVTVFMSDVHDVRFFHNPCVLVERQPDKVFVHSQDLESLAGSGFMRNTFSMLGGQYNDWYNQTKAANSTIRVLNAGVVGGRRPVVLDVLAKMRAIYQDPDFVERRGGRWTCVDMAVVNYVLYTEFATRIETGYPLHGRWGAFSNRSDVDFQHKLLGSRPGRSEFAAVAPQAVMDKARRSE